MCCHLDVTCCVCFTCRAVALLETLFSGYAVDPSVDMTGRKEKMIGDAEVAHQLNGVRLIFLGFYAHLSKILWPICFCDQFIVSMMSWPICCYICMCVCAYTNCLPDSLCFGC